MATHMIEDFALKQYFDSQPEGAVEVNVSPSYARTWRTDELLALDPNAQRELCTLGLDYPATHGRGRLGAAIASLYGAAVGAEHVLAFTGKRYPSVDNYPRSSPVCSSALDALASGDDAAEGARLLAAAASVVCIAACGTQLSRPLALHSISARGMIGIDSSKGAVRAAAASRSEG